MSPAGNGSTVAGDVCSCEDEGVGRKACSQCERKSKKTGLTSSSSSYALLSFDSFPVEDYDKRWRIFTASVKGFVIGAGIKGGLSLFAILARLRRRRSLSSANSLRVDQSSPSQLQAFNAYEGRNNSKLTDDGDAMEVVMTTAYRLSTNRGEMAGCVKPTPREVVGGSDATGGMTGPGMLIGGDW
ncbi:hypothetical protein E3N88_15214 [Mikania micrantha]|uniref:Uncharacterized protein n=1 Tax=Mikania micrantha TaxID=192012 RepID=A0A5N6NV05_9ASTR|nr:hypothetical protein E3N88_15214 [Mikania micrantha]